MTVEPTIPFPASPYCRVRARVASIWADGPDDGTHPDWIPAAGERVTLTPSIGSQLLVYDATGPEPIIVTVERVECVVDEDGWLAKADGRPVFIAPTDDPLLSATGWTWAASIKGKSVVFAAPSGGVVDLAMFIAAPATDDTKTWVERIPESIADLESAKTELEATATDLTAAVQMWQQGEDAGIAALAGDRTSATGATIRDAIGTVNVRDYGAVGDGVTDDTAAFNAANTAATAGSGRLYARGTFRINGTIYISTDADMSDAILECYGTGVAVVVGNQSAANLLRRSIRLPKVHCRTKPASGWVVGTVGVQVLNTYESIVSVPFVWQFETNLEVRGQGSGSVYNTFSIGSLNNGKVNLLLSADPTGWSNQNTFIGGRYAGNPAEGSPVAGSAQIKLTSEPPYSRPNNNVWINPSVEGGMHEYVIDCDGGENVWIQPRMEQFGGAFPRVAWRARSYYNLIQGGHSTSSIIEATETGAASNMIHTSGRWDFIGSTAGPMVKYDNRNSSTQPAWAVYDATQLKDGITAATGWRAACSAQVLGVKKEASTHAEVALLSADGSLAFGSGATAPIKKIRSFGAGIAFDKTHVSFMEHGVYDIGLSTNRPRTVRASNGIVTGAYTTAQRNAIGAAHTSMGAGAMIFDTTLNKPLWSDGTEWRDATGAIV